MLRSFGRAIVLLCLIVLLAMGSVGMWSADGVRFLISYLAVILGVIGLSLMIL